MTHRKQDRAEEIANAATHGAGAALALAALIVLVACSVRYGDAWRIAGAGIFGAALFLLYSMSALYHSVENAGAKRILRILDHTSVFLLIAGTYTPLTLVTLRGAWGWTLFGLIWGMAALGIALKLICFDRFYRLSVALYLAMGWLAVIAIKPLIGRLPRGALAWLAAGGLAYSLGVIFYKQERLRFAHAIWHVFVIGGSAAHFVAVLLYVILPVRA